jgi:hypothetical protein
MRAKVEEVELLEVVAPLLTLATVMGQVVELAVMAAV